ncbi:MAG: LysE family translocator [Candidatus Binatia bacterium]
MTFPLAFAIGFSVASIPGPTIILIATETLRRGPKAGLLTLTAPPLMDALVMVPLGLFLQASLFSGRGSVVLGLVGAAFLVWLGFQSMRLGTRKLQTSGSGFRESIIPNSKLETPKGSDREIPSFLKGVLTHLTSPYPYLYWGTVGSSFIRQGFEDGGILGAAKFPLGFWLGACAFTLAVIYLVARGKRMLPPRLEPHLHYLTGALLIGSGVYLAVSVWQHSL